MKRSVLLAALMLTCAALPSYAATVHTTDFIADGSRSNFNSFESIPNDTIYYTGGAGPYTEDGITVEQVNGDAGNTIYVTAFGLDGIFGWYPDGGDLGYTKVTRTGGIDFVDVGFLYTTGFFFGASTFWELWDDGSFVTGSNIPGTVQSVAYYLGFSGGGFDEIRLYDRSGAPDANAFAIDAIELSNGTVPEPATLSLLGLGLVAAAARRRQRKL